MYIWQLLVALREGNGNLISPTHEVVSDDEEVIRDGYCALGDVNLEDVRYMRGRTATHSRSEQLSVSQWRGFVHCLQVKSGIYLAY